MRKLYAILLTATLGFVANVNAQLVPQYSFAGSTGTYTPIVGGTVISGATAQGDDVGVGNLPIGFTFPYNGTTFTVFGFRSNGLIELGQATASLSGFSSNSLSGTANCIAPLWDDNNTTGTTMMYQTTGGAGAHVLTVQYTGMHVGGGGSSSNPTIDLQIQLFESGVIVFNYGPTSGTLSGTTASIGISGAVGSYRSVTPLSPASSSTSSTASENASISTAANFPSGTIYTFTPPPPCAAPANQATSLSFGAPTFSSVTATFTAAASAPTGYLVVRYPSGSATTNPTNATTYSAGQSLGLGTVVSSAVTTGFTATGLAAGTTYDFYVYDYNNTACAFGPVYNTTSPLSGPLTTPSGTLSGIMTVGTGGTYNNLTSAFAAINTSGLSGNVELQLITGYPAAAETYPITSATTGAGGGFTIKVYPTVSGLSITSANATGTLNLNNAAKILFDGRVNQAGANDLIIENTSTGYAVQFINDATNNTIQYCTLKAKTTTATSGTVVFSTGTVTGNDNNNLNNNLFTNAAGGNPANDIYSAGSSASIDNSGNTINNNLISDYFSATVASNGILLTSTGNSGWSITNNRLYQTASRTYTTANTHNGISIQTGSGYTITGNIIGFANSSGTGTTNILGITSGTLGGTFPSSYTLGTAVLNATKYMGMNINFTAGGTNSLIQGNTIGGFALITSSGGQVTTGIWCGISVQSGNATIGGATGALGNTIGAISGQGSIYTACSTTGGSAIGIYTTSTNTITVQNNTIGAIDASGTTATLTGGFTGIDGAGTGGVYNVSNNTIGNTTVDNIRTGYMLSGGNLSNAGTLTSSTGGTSTILGIRNTASGATLTMSNNTLRGIATSGTSTAVTGLSATGSQTSSVTVDNNLLGTASLDWMRYAVANSGTLTGITVTSSTTATSHSVQNNVVRGITYSVAGTGSNTYINFQAGTAAGNTSTISNNQFNNLNVNTTGSVTFISHSYTVAATGTQTINNNQIVTGFNKGGAGGTITGMTSSASSATGAICTHTNNNFSNITATGATGITGINSNDGSGSGATRTVTGNTFNNWTTGAGTISAMIYNYVGGTSSISSNTITNITGQSTITGLSIGSSGNVANPLTVSGNTITGLSSTGTGGNVTGLTCGNTSPVVNINGNTINTLSSAGTSSTVLGLQITGATATNVFSNVINTLSGSGATSPLVRGLQVTGGTAVNVYKNKIYDISESGAISTTAGAVAGVNLSGGTTVNLYNNTIGDLRAPAASLTDAIRGIAVTSSSASTSYNIYFNTVYINATSSGANFGVSGVYHTASATATTAKMDLRNNIIVNISTPTGTGIVSALTRSVSGTYNNWASTSDRNNFVVGTLDATHAILLDGLATVYPTSGSGFAFSSYQSTFAARDANSFTKEPSFTYSLNGSFFQSTSGSSPNFLKMVDGIATQVESGGLPITTPSITDDYFGVTRNSTTPDIGASEFNGTSPAPTISNITYSPLTACVGTARSVSATVLPGAGSLTSVVINYSLNGVAQTPVTMNNSSGDTWTGTIPAANGGATVAWSISATNDVPITVNLPGTSYADNSSSGPGISLSILGNPTRFCGTGGTTTLTANSTDLSTTYSWSVIGGNATLDVNNLATVHATMTATSDFQVTGTTSGGCVYTTTYSVGVYPLPSATVSTTASGVCPGTSATISSGLSAGNFSAACITATSILSSTPTNAVTLASAGTVVTTTGANSTTNVDDNYWLVPIGFTFNYFGTNYTNVYVSTNGILSFNAGTTSFSFPSGFPSASSPAAAIAACARDLIVSSGKLTYWTEGISPNRRFVAQWANVPNFGGYGGVQNVEAVFYETLGTVDIRVASATNGTATATSGANSALKLIGLQNGAQTIGATAPNCSTNAANYWNEKVDQITSPSYAWRFSPPSNYTTTWYANGTQFATGTNIFSEVVSPLTTTRYAISYSNQTTGCSNDTSAAAVTMVVLSATAPTGVNALSSSSTICYGASVNLSIDYTGVTDGILFQWQSSTDGGTTWSDISGATATTTTQSPTAATMYRVQMISCGGSPGYSNPVSVGFTNSVTSTTPATRCGVGTVTLQATGNSGTSINWYSDATSTTVLGTGNSFITPSISATTTYYAAAVDGSNCASGRVAVTATVTPAPTLTLSSSSVTYCGNQSITPTTVTVTAGAGSYDSYVWTPTTNITTNSTTSWTFNPTTTTNYTLTASSSGSGCVNTATYSFNVYPLPTATLSTTASGVCPGTSATINSGLSATSFTATCITAPSGLASPPGNAVVLTNAGTAVVPVTSGSLDDGYWGNIPIGFSFNYFGTPYTDLFVGTNGNVTFGTGSTQFSFAGGFPSVSNPANTIAVCARDLQLGATGGNFGFGGGAVRYWTEGSSPNRRFIVQYDNCATWYSTNATDGLSSTELVLYETTGVVDIRVIKATNPAATTGSFINDTRNKYIGLQDGTQTIGATAPNCSTNAVNYWNGVSDEITTPQAWRFSPPAHFTTTWYANGVQFASGTDIFSELVSPAVTTHYAISYTNQTTGCANDTSLASVTMVVLGTTPPAGVNTLSSSTSICAGASVNLSTDYTGITDGLTYQWQFSTDGGTTWGDIGAATAATYTASPAANTMYRLQIISCSGTPGYTNPVSVNFTNSITSTTPATRCGTGTVTLQATGNAGTTINWYADNTSTTVLGTGTSFTTPVITTNTDYYAAAISGGSCSSVRVPVTATVTTPPTFTLSGSSLAICAGQSTSAVTITQGAASYDTYNWSPSSGVSGSAGSGWIFNPTTTTTYTLTASQSSGSLCSTTADVTVTVNPLPVVSPTASPSALCTGGSTTLTASNVATGPQSLPGTYCVPAHSGGSLITDVTFNTLSNTGVTQVSPYYDIYPASGSTTTTVNAGQTYTLTVSSDAASIASVWIDFNRNGILEASEWTQLWTSATTGGVSIVIPADASAGQTTMRIRTRSTGSPNGSGDACTTFFSGSAQDYTINILSDPNAGSTINWVWTPGNLTGNSVVVSPTVTTSYTVTGTNASTGCSITSAPLTVTVGAALSIGASASPAAVCIGGSSTLTANLVGGGAPYTYSWTVQGSGTVLGTSSTLSVSPTSTTTYQLAVTDNCGNAGTTTVTVTVNPLPTVTVSPSGPLSVCAANQLLSATTNAASAGFQWLLNGNNIASATGATYLATNATTSGNYSVRVTNGVTGCFNTSAATAITFNAFPSAITVTPATPATICLTSSQTLTASATASGSATPFSETFESFPLSQFSLATITAGPYTATQNTTVHSQGSSSVNLNTTATSSNGGLTSSTVNLSPYSAATLSFSNIASMEFSGSFYYDFGIVEYSSDGGTTWTQFQAANYAGSANSAVFSGGVRFNSASYTAWNTNSTAVDNTMWKNETFTIPAAALTNQFKVRFRYTTDVSTNWQGWFIDNVQISAVASGVRYAWSVTTGTPANAGLPAGAGTAATSNNSISVTPTAAGNYVYTVTASIPGTSCTSTNTVSVNVNTPAVAPTSLTPSTSICNGDNVTLTQTGGSLGTGGYWQWYGNSNFTNPIGGHLTSSDASLVVSPSSAQTYYVRAEGSAPCANASNPALVVSITVKQPSVAPTAVNATSTAICSGTQVTLTQTGGSLGTGGYWQWYSDANFTTTVGGHLFTSTASIGVTPSVTTTYYLRAEGSAPCANSGDNTVNVTVSVGQGTVAPTSISATLNPICFGQSTVLTQVGGTLGSGATWHWYDDVTLANEVFSTNSPSASFVASPTVTTTYYLRAEGGQAPCVTPTTVRSITITVNGSPTISYAGTPFCKTGVAFVTLTGQPGGTYSSDAGMSLNATTGYLYIGNSTVGTHTITYTVPSAGGCNSTGTTIVTILPLPTLTLGTAPTICQNTPAAVLPYTVTGGNPTTYSIRSDVNNPMPNYVPVVNVPLSAGSTGTINVQVPANTPGGTYYFDLTVANTHGCVSPGKYVFAVTVATPPTTTISYAGTPFCGTSVGFVTRTPAGGTFSSTTGLNINATTGTIYPAPSTPGNYTVTYTLVLNGCTYTATTPVTILPTPGITIGSIPMMCFSAGAQTALLPYTATSNSPVSYSISADPSSPMANFTPVVDAPLTGSPISVAIPAGTLGGTYKFDLYVKSAQGCSSVRYTFTVTIVSNTTTIAYNGGQPVCQTGTMFVTLSGASGGTYTSDANLNINSATGAIYPAASTLGTHTVTYTITTAGCSFSTTTDVTIVALPKVTIGTIAPVCVSAGAQTASVPYTVTASTPVSYSITVGTSNPMPGYVAVTNASISNPIVVNIPAGTSPGTYSFYLTLKSAGGCVSSKYTFFVTVKPVPTASIAYTNSPYSTAVSGAAVTNSGTTGGTYSSTAGLNLNTVTGSIFPHQSTPGTYTVTYTVTTAANCTATTTTQVTIVAAPTPRIVSTGTPGKGTTTTKTAPVAAAEVEETITIAPNPVEHRVTVRVSNFSDPMQIRVTDATGKEILKSTKFTSSYGFDMSGYAQGIYMVEVVNEQTGTVTRKKLMKR